MDHAGKILVNGAPTQLDRWRHALDAGATPVDGRGFEDLLGTVTGYAGVVRYWDHDNRPSGTWRPFFSQDPTMVLSDLLTTDTRALQRDYEALEARFNDARQAPERLRLFARLFALAIATAARCDGWLTGMGHQATENPSGRVLRHALTRAIEKELAPRMTRLLNWGLGAGQGEALGAGLRVLARHARRCRRRLPLWPLGDVDAETDIFKGPSEQARMASALPALFREFRAVLRVIEELRAVAGRLLEGSLTEAGHQPHLALTFAFLRLFAKTQHSLNLSSERILDLYYRRMLRGRPAGPVGDEAYLALRLAEDAPGPALVRKGTLFAGGSDKGGARLYEAPGDFTVTAAVLTDLRGLRVVTAPLLDQPGAPRVVTAALTSRVDLKQAPPFPLFGATAPLPGVAVTPAELGFAIGSKLLALEGGQRTIRLDLRQTEASRARLTPLLERLAAATGLAGPVLLADLLEKALECHLSTAAGWLPVAVLQVEALAPLGDARLIVALPAAVAAVTALDPKAKPLKGLSTDPKVVTGNPWPLGPSLKVHLRQEPVRLGGRPVPPLALLAGLELARIELEVEVDDLAPQHLANPDGAVSAAAPFPAFGAVPSAGSYLEIGHPELFAKPLNRLAVAVDWHNLPGEGFAAHYAEWAIGPDHKPQPGLFDTARFQASLSLRGPGGWEVAEPAANLPLFAGEGPVPHPASAFQPALRPATAGAYYDPAGSRLRLTLTGPSYGFGNDLYARNVMHAVSPDMTGRIAQPQQQAQAGPAGAPGGIDDPEHDDPALCERQCQELSAAAKAVRQFATAPKSEPEARALLDDFSAKLRASFIDLFLSALPGAAGTSAEQTRALMQNAPAATLAKVLDQCSHQLPPTYKGRVRRCRTLVEGLHALETLPKRLHGTSDLPQQMGHLADRLDIFYRECCGSPPKPAPSLACDGLREVAALVSRLAGRGDAALNTAMVMRLHEGRERLRGLFNDLYKTLGGSAPPPDSLDGPGLAQALDKVTPPETDRRWPSLRRARTLVEGIHRLDMMLGNQMSPYQMEVLADWLKQLSDECAAIGPDVTEPPATTAPPPPPTTAPPATTLPPPPPTTVPPATTLPPPPPTTVPPVTTLPPPPPTTAPPATTLPPPPPPTAPPATTLSPPPPTTVPPATTRPPPPPTTAPPVTTPPPTLPPFKPVRYPNPPWLPQAKGVRLSYRAAAVLDPATDIALLTPFGGWVRPDPAEPLPLLPRLLDPARPVADAGHLYLGFSGLQPPQQLTVLARLTAEGPGDAPKPVWSVLDRDRWLTLTPGQMRGDRSNGLRDTGLITISLPAHDRHPATLLPEDRHWLRVSAQERPADYPRALGFHPNGLRVRWHAAGNSGAGLGTPVPPGTIKAMDEVPGLDKVEQPMPSFGGRPPEDERAFTIRLGERLRHKDRAVVAWDYERLVMERYPAMWMVKTIEACRPGDPRPAPGHVTVAVVPGRDATDAADPTTPRVSPGTLAGIQANLRDCASPFAEVHVVNPAYVRVTVTAAAVFGAEQDVGACLRRLDEELVAWLSPWFHSEHRAGLGAGYALEDGIRDFIQTRPYVDGLAEIAFAYDPPPQDLRWYLLTSAPRHQLTEAVPDAPAEEPAHA